MLVKLYFLESFCLEMQQITTRQELHYLHTCRCPINEETIARGFVGNQTILFAHSAFTDIYIIEITCMYV